LRAGGFSGPELDLWLIALRVGSATSAVAARRLGLEPRVMRPRISRWMRADAAGFVQRDDSGNYRLTAVGAGRADRAVQQLRALLVRLKRTE